MIENASSAGDIQLQKQTVGVNGYGNGVNCKQRITESSDADIPMNCMYM